MYGNEMRLQAAQCEAGKTMLGQQIDHNPTVEENIDAKIALLRKEIDRLEESKKTLSPLLGMRIRDIHEAMRF